MKLAILYPSLALGLFAVSPTSAAGQAAPVESRRANPPQAVPGILPPPARSVPVLIDKQGRPVLPPVAGSGPKVADYNVIRSDDVYRPDPTRFAENLKNIPLDLAGDVRLTLFGEERVRASVQDYSSFVGAGKKGQPILLLRHRYGADLSLGDHFRVFSELVSGQQISNNTPLPKNARQSNDVDISQLFAEVRGSALGGQVGARGGRQQMFLGSGEIFAVQQAPNVLRNFDGFRGYYNSPYLRIDIFRFIPLRYGNSAFDDVTDSRVKLSGIYAVVPLLRRGSLILNTDVFYIDYNNTAATFNRLSGVEHRDIFGSRLWGRIGRVRSDMALVAQSGNLSGRPIRAALLQSTTSLALTPSIRSPVIGLQLDVATGGKSGNVIRTYNPLYSANERLTASGFLTPSNIINVAPQITVPLTDNLGLIGIGHFYWRYSIKDAVYGQAFVTLLPALRSADRYTGMQPSIATRWRYARNGELRFTIAKFRPSKGLSSSGFKSVGLARLEWIGIF